jgi:hypothetical protein
MWFLEGPPSGASLLADCAGDAKLSMTRGEHFVSGENAAGMKDRPVELLADDRKREEIARQRWERARSIRTDSHTARQVSGDWGRDRG